MPFSYGQICNTKVPSFQHVYEAVATATFPPILTSNSSFVTIRKYHNTYLYEAKKVTDQSLFGYCITITKSVGVVHSQNLFMCLGGAYISVKYVCDGVHDCPEETASDEVVCKCSGRRNQTKFCKFIISSKGKTMYGPLYIPIHGTCKLYGTDSNVATETTHTDSNVEMNTKNCSSLLNLPVTVNESIFDVVGHQEISMKGACNTLYMYTCSNECEIPCRDNYSHCFGLSQICLYKLCSTGDLMPCKTGEHLQNCRKFPCSASLKCPQSYCI